MRRIRITLWLLVAIAVVSTGVLTRALGWHPGPAAGATVAAGGVSAIVAVALAARILVVSGRGR